MAVLEITDVTVHTVEGPRPWAFVQVETDTGLTGVGEITGCLRHTGIAGLNVIERLGKRLLGENPFDTERLFGAGGRLGAAPNDAFATRVSAGFDQACWDIKGKHLGVPVHELLGGKLRDEVRAYANGWDFRAREIVDRYHSGDDPNTVLGDVKREITDAAREVVDAGYTALKFSPFQWGDGPTTTRLELDHAFEVIGAVDETVPDEVELLIEGHSHLSTGKAASAARQLERVDPGFYEEPVHPELTPLGTVAREARVSVAAGEQFATHRRFAEVLDAVELDVVQPDPGTVGGITELVKVGTMASAHRLDFAPHNAAGPIQTAVAVHVDATEPAFMVQETFEEFFHPDWNGDLLVDPLVIEDGYIEVPDRPGLGVELDMDVLREHSDVDAENITTIGGSTTPRGR